MEYIKRTSDDVIKRTSDDVIKRTSDDVKEAFTKLFHFKRKEMALENSSKIIEDPPPRENPNVKTNEIISPPSGDHVVVVVKEEPDHDDINYCNKKETNFVSKKIALQMEKPIHEDSNNLVKGLICSKTVLINNILNEQTFDQQPCHHITSEKKSSLPNELQRRLIYKTHDKESLNESEDKDSINSSDSSSNAQTISSEGDLEYESINSSTTNSQDGDSPEEEGEEEKEDFALLGIKDRYTHEDLGTKDCGYSWVILCMMFISNILTYGYVKGFAILYTEIQNTLPQSNAKMSGAMMSLLTGFRSICAPITGIMMRRFGGRSTMIVGVLIYSGSLFAAYFCESFTALAITLAALPGLSQSIIETCQVVFIPQYFETKFSVANGIRVAGNPCGGIFYTLLLNIFLENFGLDATKIAMVCVTFQLFFVAFLMRPFKTHVKIKVLDQTKKVLSNYSETNKQYKRKVYKDILRRSQHLLVEGEQKKYNWKLLKNPHFLTFVFVAMIIPMGLPLILFNATLYAKSIGISRNGYSALTSSQAGFDLIVRIVLGKLINTNKYKKTYGFSLCLFICAVGTLSIPFTSSLPQLIGVIFLFTFGPASYHCFVNVILTERFGKENIASTFGFVRMTQGIFSFIHPFLIGLIHDETGSFKIPFIIMGSSMFLCGLIILAESWMVTCFQRFRPIQQNP